MLRLIDPGVGSSRRSILIQTANTFVLADNDCLANVGRSTAISPDYSKYFAIRGAYLNGARCVRPVAAALSNGSTNALDGDSRLRR